MARLVVPAMFVLLGSAVAGDARDEVARPSAATVAEQRHALVSWSGMPSSIGHPVGEQALDQGASFVLPEVRAIKERLRAGELIPAQDDGALDPVAPAPPFKSGGRLRVERAVDGITDGAQHPGSCSLAVGPGHIVAAVSSVWGVYSPAGELLRQASLQDWFASVAPPSNPVEPQVAYDEDAGRWILAAAAGDPGGEGAAYLIAVSEGGDPLGRWWSWSLDAAADGGQRTDNVPRDLLLGFDPTMSILLTSNQYGPDREFRYAKLRVLPKEGLYWTGGGGPVAWKDFWNWTNEDLTPVFSWRPVIAVDPMPFCTYLVNAVGPAEGRHVSIWKVTEAVDPDLHFVGTVSVDACVAPPDAEQKDGLALIATGDCRIASALYRDGTIVCVRADAFLIEPQSRAAFVYSFIDVEELHQTRSIFFGNSVLHYFCPTIIADTRGDLFIAFNSSGAEEYIALRSALRPYDDDLARSSVAIREGVSCFAPPGARPLAKWGTGCAIALSSAQQDSALIFGPYAGAESRWATVLAEVAFGEFFRRGDCNADSQVNIADALCVLSYLFKGAGPLACKDAGDSNDDGSLNIGDAITILGHLFRATGPLPEPFATCGRDPAGDRLDCDSHPACE